MYWITKSQLKVEYRVYIDESLIDGNIIYNGHKLAVETNLLLEIIDYRIEKSTNKIYFLNYTNVDFPPNHIELSLWDVGKQESIDRNLFESWMSLISKIKNNIGNFRKIIVTKVNI